MTNNKKNPVNSILFLNLSLIVIDLLLIVIFYNSLPENIPLFFSEPWGKDQMTNKYLIFINPLLLIFFLIISVVLRKLLNKNGSVFLEITPFVFSLISSAVLIISLIRIIMLVY